MKCKKRKPRCKHVAAILTNKLQVFPCLREETWPPLGDFADGPIEYMVVRFKGAGSNDEVMIPLSCVVFL